MKLTIWPWFIVLPPALFYPVVVTVFLKFSSTQEYVAT
jgi:hypothetical protein